MQEDATREYFHARPSIGRLRAGAIVAVGMRAAGGRTRRAVCRGRRQARWRQPSVRENACA
jgi:hypothetical protein